MLAALVQSLVDSKNEAADDVLLEALRLGTEPEKALALNALLRRRTQRGLVGVVSQFAALPESLRGVIFRSVKAFHPALREGGRSQDVPTALAAMKIIALSRQGKLTYILAEGLHNPEEDIAKAAVEAMVALSRWAAVETRKLHTAQDATDEQKKERQRLYHQLVDDRPEIEQAVARAIDVHRGKYGPDLLRAALLLADSPASKTAAILKMTKHGGLGPMTRRLQQMPDSEHVEAFLIAAAHGGLRAHFGVTMSHIVDPPVLDALLRRTHWLKDQQLALCVHHVSRGVWWGDAELDKDLARRDDTDAALIGEWIGASGTHDVMQDAKLERLCGQMAANPAGRLRLLRVAMRRPRGASTALIRTFLKDGDERFVRMAAREIVRRQPPDYENTLIQLMSHPAPSVRRVIARSVGQVGFDHFWERYDHLDKATRRSAGRAMLKLLPDGLARLERRIRHGTLEQRLKAVNMAQELGMPAGLLPALHAMCRDANPRLRSRAVTLVGEADTTVPAQTVLDQALNDADARVRANAIEVLEAKHSTEYIPMLTQRARHAPSRERANAIKALHTMRVETASNQLLAMIQDERPEHRISAMWALKQIGWWKMLSEVGRLAKEDQNLRVRRYALAILRTVSDVIKARQTPPAAAPAAGEMRKAV